MAPLKLAIIALVVILQLTEAKSLDKLTVMMSQANPFAFHENGVFKGLEVKIVENFAKKLKLNVNYILANESLNEIFLTDGRFENVTEAMRYA